MRRKCTRCRCSRRRCSRADVLRSSKCCVCFSPIKGGRADRHRTCCCLPRAQAAVEGSAAGIRFANVDIEKHGIARNIYGISAVPTMRIFSNGRMSEEVGTVCLHPAVAFPPPLWRPTAVITGSPLTYAKTPPARPCALTRGTTAAETQCARPFTPHPSPLTSHPPNPQPIRTTAARGWRRTC